MGMVCTDFIFALGRVTPASRAHRIQIIAHPHDLSWTSRHYYSKKAAISSPVWTLFFFFFFWRYWLDDHARKKKSIGMPSVHHLKICFWSGQNIELSSITESPLAWSKPSRVSSVVGAPSGRHSRLGPALYSIIYWIRLLHDQLGDIC